MNIGDKVRMLHGTEEGIIRKIVDKRMVEVEIEDGFLIPVLKNEIVVIAPEEKKDLKSEIQYFQSDPTECIFENFSGIPPYRCYRRDHSHDFQAPEAL